MIIGLTGTYCAGKDTAAEYIEKQKGFFHFSLSDELRLELQKRGIEPTRENLIAVGTELRAAEGNEVLASRVLSRVEEGKNYIVTSVRHPAEIDEMRKRLDFCMVNIDAPQDIRFRRMRKRGRPGDPETLEKFREFERKEFQSEGSGQQIGECIKHADFTIMNDGDRPEELYNRIDRFLRTLESRGCGR
ncbi:MAG: AAA family ATPase [Endomicrobiales bacterium]|nr:AAA family ATPase [Endomicrobiales bacterium]